MSNRFTRAMATRDAIRRQHRLYDQLDAIPEPDILPPVAGASSMGDSPHCWKCKRPVEDVGWHVDPDTGGYECDHLP